MKPLAIFTFVLTFATDIQAAAGEKPLPLEPEEETLVRTVHTMFYKARSKKTGNMWDVWLYRHQGTYFLYYLAKEPHGGEFGFGESLDGVHWKALPPPTVVDAGVDGGRRHGEVGAVEKIGDKYYMMFGHSTTEGTETTETGAVGKLLCRRIR